MFELFIFLFVLAVFTAIGHGIWVVVSIIIRAIFGQSSSSSNSFSPPPTNDPKAFRHVLERMRYQGLISPEEFVTLMQKADQAYSASVLAPPVIKPQLTAPPITRKPIEPAPAKPAIVERKSPTANAFTVSKEDDPSPEAPDSR